MEFGIYLAFPSGSEDRILKRKAIIEKETELVVRMCPETAEFPRAIDAIAESQYFMIATADGIITGNLLSELTYAASEHKRIVILSLDESSLSSPDDLLTRGRPRIADAELTDEHFADVVRRIFLDPSAWPENNRFPVRDAGEALTREELCYPNREQKARMKELLSAEIRGEWALCCRPENAYLLGMAYEWGIAVGKDTEQADFYYEISSKLDNPEGRFLNASFRIAKGEKLPELYLEKTDAAEQGSVFALTELGQSFYLGTNSCIQNPGRAFSCWKRAADAGGTAAMYCLARGYENGVWGGKESNLADMYALLAEEAGFPRKLGSTAQVCKSNGHSEENSAGGSDKPCGEAVCPDNADELSGELISIDCKIRGILEKERKTSGEEAVKDRKEMIRWYQEFLALADDKAIEKRQKTAEGTRELSRYLFDFAVELDVLPDPRQEEDTAAGSVPGKKLAKACLVRSLKNSRDYWCEIAEYILEKWLRAGEAGAEGPSAYSVRRAAELFGEIRGGLKDYRRFLLKYVDIDNETEEKWNSLKTILKTSFETMAEYWKEQDSEKSDMLRKQGESIGSEMEEIKKQVSEEEEEKKRKDGDTGALPA